MKINYDYWWLVRQQWVNSLQTHGSASEIKTLVYWVVLGILFTCILMVW